MTRAWPAIVALIAIVVLPSPAAGEDPWSSDLRHPIVATTPDVEDHAAHGHAAGPTSPITLVASAAIRFYQLVLSPVDGPTCPFYPTCSGYGMQAVRRHGWLLGAMFAAERIARYHGDVERYGLITKFGVRRLDDPLDDNDGWLR